MPQNDNNRKNSMMNRIGNGESVTQPRKRIRDIFTPGPGRVASTVTGNPIFGAIETGVKAFKGIGKGIKDQQQRIPALPGTNVPFRNELQYQASQGNDPFAPTGEGAFSNMNEGVLTPQVGPMTSVQAAKNPTPQTPPRIPLSPQAEASTAQPTAPVATPQAPQEQPVVTPRIPVGLVGETGVGEDFFTQQGNTPRIPVAPPSRSVGNTTDVIQAAESIDKLPPDQQIAALQRLIADIDAEATGEIGNLYSTGGRRGITAGFATGVEGALRRQALAETEPLRDRLGFLQEERQFNADEAQRNFDNSIKLAELNLAREKARQSNLQQTGISPITGKPFNESQSRAATFANRIEDAEDIINGGRGVFNPLIPKFLRGQDRRSFEQAESNFITAVLRRESGAAIAPSEFDDARTVYIPVPGDSPEVLAQKARNREIALQGLINESVGAYEQLKQQIGAETATETGGGQTLPAGTTGVTSSGIKFTIEQ